MPDRRLLAPALAVAAARRSPAACRWSRATSGRRRRCRRPIRSRPTPPSRRPARRRPTSTGSASSPTRGCKRLIELALANNRDLRVAVLNIEQARALYDVRRADEWPTRRHRRQRRARRDRQRQHRQRLHRRRSRSPRYELDLFGRVRTLSEAALDAVPGDRGGAQGGADQPGRRRRDDLPRAAGRRRAARRHPADAGDARGIDPPHQAALRQRRVVRARLPAVRVAARRRARRAGADAAPARARRERAAAAGRPAACRPTCRRRCRSTKGS